MSSADLKRVEVLTEVLAGRRMVASTAGVLAVRIRKGSQGVKIESEGPIPTMKLQIANTEPFVQFHEFLEALDRNTKVSFGALTLVRQSPPNALSIAGNKLVQLPTGNEPWGPNTRWLDLDVVVSESLLFLAQMGLMQVFSAFGDFLVGVKGEFDRSQKILHGKQAEAVDDNNEKDLGLRYCCAAIGLDIAALEPAMPLYDYFEKTRNCLAHRRGRASQELLEFGASSELAGAIAAWPLRKGKSLPELPVLQRGKQIPLLARHVIYAGIVCRFISGRVNQHLVSCLGESGMVFMAAHHSLLANEPVLRVTVKNNMAETEAVVNSLLSGRYRVTTERAHEAQKILQSINQWSECRKRFRQLYPATILVK